MSSWESYKLSELCQIYDGPHATPPKTMVGNVFLGISSINYDGRIDNSQFEYVDDEYFAKWTRRILPIAKDIVFSYETKLGTAAIIPEGFKCCLGRRMGLLRCNNKVVPEFLLYYYLSPEFQGVIQERTYSGSTVDRIPLKEMGEFPVRLPSLLEQKAIASVLSSLDDKIDLLHRQNKTLEAMAETLFRQWFIEEAKEDWEDCILGDILEVLESGSRPKGGIDPELKSGIPSLGAESINGICKFDYSKVKYVTLEFADSCKKGHAQPWDVLIYKDGAYVGKKALFGEKFPYPRFMINEHVFRLRSNTRCSQLYLYFALDSESLALLNSNSAQPGINQQSLKSYQITLPPKEKMEAFDSVVRPLTTKMNENAIQISTCEKLRDTLLSKLMSGEVRVQFQTEEVA